MYREFDKTLLAKDHSDSVYSEVLLKFPKRNCHTIKLTNCSTVPSGSGSGADLQVQIVTWPILWPINLTSAQCTFIITFVWNQNAKYISLSKDFVTQRFKNQIPPTKFYSFINAEKFILQTMAKRQTHSLSLSPDNVFAFGQCLQLLLLIPCMLPVDPGFCLLGILFDLLPRDTFPPLKPYKYINN